MDPQLFSQPLTDYNLDGLTSKDGVVETLPFLSLNLDDEYIIKNLHDAIEDSQDWYNNVTKFNLRNKRLKNEQMLEGKHLQEHKLYRHQTPYIDSELFVGVDSIMAYVTAQTPRAEVYPASDKDESKVMATDLEQYMHAHSDKFDLPRKMEGAVYNMVGKYIGLLKLRWDPLYGKNGEIVPEVVDPNFVIVDKNAKLGENPRFICHVLKDTIEGLVAKFPEKSDEILALANIKRRGKKNVTAEVVYREVWFTYWDEDNKPQEAVAWYTSNVVLHKCKDPNYLYDNEGANFLDAPMKPFIPFNITNDGSNWIDKNNALEQAIPQQDILNKLGRQIIDNLATANGFKVLDSHAMSSEDAQNFTGDPNQLLIVKTKPNQSVRDVIEQLPPQIVSSELISYAQEVRQVLHGILGTPSQFTGSSEDETKTASEALMIKNQASGRQDKIVRSVDYAMNRYFQFLAQMITVWYTDTHYATVNGGDGNFDFIEMHKDKVEAGMTVRVQSGTTLPFDKSRQEAVAMNLVKEGLLSPYDVYKLLHMDNPQKLYDNFMKWKQDPQQLAMDVSNNEADRQALVDWTELMAGKQPEQREDASFEYVEQMRKKMISDEFLNAKKPIQSSVIKFVNKALDSLEVRTEMDNISKQEEQSPPQPPLPPQVAATGLPPVMQMPFGQPAPGQAPMGQGMPPQAMPQPQQGSPIQAIMQAQLPTPGAAAPNLGATQPQVNAGNVGQMPPF